MSTETTKSQIDPNKIVIKNVRLSYPHLFVAKQGEGASKAKFSADLILNKKQHAETIKQIEKMIERVSLDFFKKKVTLKNCALHDGNEREDKEGYGDDVMFVVAKNDNKPDVVDRDPTVKLKPEDRRPYGGCYVNASIRFYAYDHKTGGKGVSSSLEAVQFYKDGPSFGAGPVNGADEFENIADEAENDGL